MELSSTVELGTVRKKVFSIDFPAFPNTQPHSARAKQVVELQEHRESLAKSLQMTITSSIMFLLVNGVQPTCKAGMFCPM